MEQPRETQAENTNEESNLLARVDLDTQAPINGIVLGKLVRLSENEGAFVCFPGSAPELPARATVNLGQEAVGDEVALMFLDGSPARPIILGRIQNPAQPAPVTVTSDGKKQTISASSELRLECGKASILLKADGKIVLRGTNIISRSSGPNKIKGASVGIN